MLCVETPRIADLLWKYRYSSHCFVTNKIVIKNRKDPDQPGSYTVIQDYGSKDRNPEEIFTDPQHQKKERETIQAWIFYFGFFTS
jgi:hypothetical protein